MADEKTGDLAKADKALSKLLPPSEIPPEANPDYSVDPPDREVPKKGSTATTRRPAGRWRRSASSRATSTTTRRPRRLTVSVSGGEDEAPLGNRRRQLKTKRTRRGS